MSYCRKEGKDTIIFATEEYLSTPSKTELLEDDPNDIDNSNMGAILPNGEINWDCPCLGNLPSGPCGSSFKEAFTCWVDHKDDEEQFAEKCYENFIKWETCLGEHRDIYRKSGDPEPEEKSKVDDAATTDSANQKISDAPSEALPPLDDVDEKSANDSSQESARAIAAASVPEK